MKIPKKSRAPKTVIKELKAKATQDIDYEGGRTWSLAYHVSDKHKKFVAEAHSAFASTNLLNPLAFQSLKEMETEIVQMTAGMLNGSPSTVGTVTSGGTESILLAVKAAREMGKRKIIPQLGPPNIVVPDTIHVAFDKAAHYFGLKLKRVKLDDDFRVNVKELKKAVDRNTVLIAASAPQYAHGMVDPIEEIAAFAKKKKIPFHVDACFGGFVLPWFEKLGEPVPLFDFRVDGVTSISADIHKYGYSAKGASVLLYSEMAYLKHQFFVATDWPGGIYASPTVLGTRPGGPIAAAWATLQSLGEEGYLEITKEVIAVKNEMKEGIAAIKGLKILGSKHGPIVTYASDEEGIDLYAVADLMQQKKWAVDRQQKPASVHCTINAINASVTKIYLADLAEAVETVRQHPELAKEGQAAMYGMMAKIPVRGAVKIGVTRVMESMHLPEGMDTSGGIPEDPLMDKLNNYANIAFDAWDKIRRKTK